MGLDPGGDLTMGLDPTEDQRLRLGPVGDLTMGLDLTEDQRSGLGHVADLTMGLGPTEDQRLGLGLGGDLTMGLGPGGDLTRGLDHTEDQRTYGGKERNINVKPTSLCARWPFESGVGPSEGKNGRVCDSGACSSQLCLKLPVVRDLCAGINKLATEPISLLPDGP
ncbi:hypothetical protein CRG98_015258 [Punica granatum]|uniref:Uncharacterized protein n=1 Tax=Punica granatum TaxID=22663 RepID=A0A2I0K837_PUNGR|nr:hypothetical protein CRG98_015258 [Punica granatum]